jgi:hypothetical protein
VRLRLQSADANHPGVPDRSLSEVNPIKARNLKLCKPPKPSGSVILLELHSFADDRGSYVHGGRARAEERLVAEHREDFDAATRKSPPLKYQ